MVDMKDWLQDLNLGEFAQSFAANHIDFDVLPDLTDAELGGLGLSLGQRKRLRQAIVALQTGDAAQLRSFVATPAASAIRPHEAQAEWRQMTVMFCDLVGSTEMSTQLDPEDLRDILHAYQRVCAEVIGSFDGFIAQYQGDGILAYFGYPHAHEREAERAVRCGLAMLSSVAEISIKATIELRVRIGIATGRAVVGDVIGRGAAARVSITGKTPNLAARIQAFADPGTLVIADGTQRLVMGEFECKPLGAQHLKGIAETVDLWHVLRELSDAERFEAKQTSQPSCVGRDRELGLLLDRWKLAAGGTGEAIVVSGEAGIGKSRLAALLRERLPAHTYINIRLQCAPQYRNSPLYPIIVHLQRAAGFEADDTPTAKLAKIEHMMAIAGSVEGAALVAALLSVPAGDRYPPLAMSPARQRAQTLEVLIDQLLGLAAQQTILLIVEDAHWLDPTSEETLIRLLDRLHKHRILMVLTTRPDYASPLFDHPRAITLTLGRLGPEATKQMISEVSGGRTLSKDMVERILIKTDGVPLFIEELTKTILESELLQASEEAYRLDGTPPPLSIPSTLEDTLRSRLDRLSSLKDVAQVGAAIGRSFSYAIVAAVMNQDDELLRSALARLVESKLIYQRGESPDAIYTFKHALVQEAAYESLLRRQRFALHARIVSAIESQFAEIAETEPELLAHHCWRAELGEKAVAYWLKAGARALSRSANFEAINHLRNGLERLPAVPSVRDRTRLELELQLALGQASIAVRGYTAVETTLAFTRAEQLVEKIGDASQRYSALYGIFVGHLIGGRIDVAAETVGRMYELAQRGGEDAYLCLAHRLVGSLAFFRGDLPQAQQELENAVALYDPAKRRQLATHFGPDTGLAAQIFLAMTEWLRGRPESAVRTAQSAIAGARQLEHALTLGQVLTLAAQLYYMSQDYETMLQLSKEGGDKCERIGIRYFGAICRLYEIWAQSRHSNSVDFIDEFRRSLATYEEMKCGLQLGLFHAMLAQLLLAAGKPADAAKEAETALATTTASGERWWLPEIYRTLGDALVASSSPDLVEAQNCFLRAIAEARRSGALMLELRAARSLADILIRRGVLAEAQRTLAPIIAQFSEGLDSPDVRVARVLLDGKRQTASL